MQLNERGTLLGIHAQRDGFFDVLRQAAGQGTPIPLVKKTESQTAFADVKRDSPDTLTMGRVIHGLDGLQGIANEGQMTDQRAREWASAVMNPTFSYLGQNPGLVEHLDIWEVVNEPDPPTVQGWHNFGLVMRECVRLGRERLPGLSWAIGSFNAGTPEWNEAQAFLDSGVLSVAPEHTILAVHEGILDPSWPIDYGHGELIPGAPAVPEHGGSMVGRIAYFAELAGDDMVPVVVSEAYLQAYDDEGEAARRAMWMDDFYSQLWFVLAFCPFTHSPTKQWDDQDYSGMYPRLLPYMVDVADRQNATRSETPQPPPVDQFVWDASLERDTINEDAALQRAIFARGMVPYATEFWQRRPETDEIYAIQTAYDWPTRTRAVAYAKVPDWGNVRVITGPDAGAIPIVFAAWPTDFRVITQRFGVGDYSRFSLPGHDGVDLRAPTSTPVYAVQRGTVAFAGTGEAYGNFVIVDHGLGVTTAYAHCERLLVTGGQEVQAGEQIATADDTGNSSGSHLHLTLKWAGHTYTDANGVSWPRNYFDPTPLLMPFDPTFVGEEKETIDLLPYLMGAHGHSHEMQYSLGGKTGTHPLQMHHDGQSFYIVKGWDGEYESLYYDDEVLYRDVDTSEAPNRFYVQRTIEDGKEYDGAPWAARHMAVGDTFHRQPRVVHFWQDTCKVRLQGDPASTLTLLAHHDSLTFSRTGITVEDVVVLSWSGGERYFFARGESLVGFEVGSGWSYISERHNRSLSRNLPPCYVAKTRYWRT